MDAVRVENINNLVYNKFGIKEPADTTKIIDKNYIDLCIVPGGAFDGQLNRIGYGKGFYDRFLQRTEIKKVALAFSCQITDSLPVEAYDVKMDAVVTEDKIYGDL
jgi:5-formyltetrahydrofolate cyclo-ligase